MVFLVYYYGLADTSLSEYIWYLPDHSLQFELQIALHDIVAVGRFVSLSQNISFTCVLT